MKALNLIQQLSSLDGRIGFAERPAFDLLTQELKKSGLAFSIQAFMSKTPIFLESSLKIDGQEILCLPTGLKSGTITNNYNLISSLTSSQSLIDTPNINFNPQTDEICVCNFYFAPSLAISRKDINKVMQARKIEGKIRVKQRNFKSFNILVGQRRKPKYVVFAHYDAFFSGATDNASGVGVVMELISTQPKALEETLFVFTGNEELSYDYPVYWGSGFRQFRLKNPGLLEIVRKTIVVDCVGDTTPLVYRDPKMVKLAFPIGNFPGILAKTSLISGEYDSLMPVYHGPTDTIKRLQGRYLDEAIQLLCKKINLSN